MALKGLLRTRNVISSSLFGKAEKRFVWLNSKLSITDVFPMVGIFQHIPIRGERSPLSQNKLRRKEKDLWSQSQELGKVSPKRCQWTSFWTDNTRIHWAEPNDALLDLVALVGRGHVPVEEQDGKQNAFFLQGRTWSPGLDRWKSTASHLHVTTQTFHCRVFLVRLSPMRS